LVRLLPGRARDAMATLTAPCPHGASDEQLLACVAAGNRQALDELFRRYRQPAYRVAYRLLGHEADALDAVQEGFIKALTHLHGFQGRSSFKTWLLRVISNAALDLGRQRNRRDAVSLDAPYNSDLPDSRLLTADEAGRRLERDDLRQQLDKALDCLSDVQRQTFVLFADGELTYREIAEVMHTSIGTVMSRLFYARRKLRNYLNERGSL
jgi:RNA polymerase sigma-70 factor, ECF subfamily